MIRINHRADLGEFIRLNEAWISRYFSLEAADRHLANTPWKVIDDGGFVFSLIKDARVIGVCALFKMSEQDFQLARMAVDAEYQGRGHGSMLMSAALDKLEEIGARRVYLLSNTKLRAALNLYRKYGFRVLSEGAHPDYARVDIVMEKLL